MKVMKVMKVMALDFDGVINSYASGYTGTEVVDPPVAGCREFVEEVLADGWQVIVHTCRGDTPERKAAVERYLAEHGFPALPVTNVKPAARVYIDDRGIRFDGDWEAVRAMLQQETWHKEMRMLRAGSR